MSLDGGGEVGSVFNIGTVRTMYLPNSSTFLQTQGKSNDRRFLLKSGRSDLFVFVLILATCAE